jgi:hypothetical protein
MNMNDAQAFRAALLEQHARELQALDLALAALARANHSLQALSDNVAPSRAPKRRAAKPKRRIASRAAPESSSGPWRRRLGESGERLALIVGTLDEPFDVAAAKAMFLEKHPDRADWVETGNIASQLLRWHDQGLLERTAGGGGKGKRSSYKRSATWTTANRESAWRSFRAGVKIPVEEAEEA